jgi:hypothetical protein
LEIGDQAIIRDQWHWHLMTQIYAHVLINGDDDPATNEKEKQSSAYSLCALMGVQSRKATLSGWLFTVKIPLTGNDNTGKSPFAPQFRPNACLEAVRLGSGKRTLQGKKNSGTR